MQIGAVPLDDDDIAVVQPMQRLIPPSALAAAGWSATHGRREGAREMQRQLVQVLIDPGRVQDDAAAARQTGQVVDEVRVGAVHGKLHPPVRGRVDQPRQPEETARRQR